LNKTRPPSQWDDPDRVQELTLRWAAGQSCTQIGAAMGITRSTVIGKVHRLGLPARAVAAPRSKPRATLEELEERRKRKYAAQVARRQAASKKKLSPAPTPAQAITELPIASEPLNIPMAELRMWSKFKSNQCRFIADEPPGPLFRTCGQPTPVGESYCVSCHRIAHKLFVPHVSTWRSRQRAA
jgi:GcrA cell cycle regulator